MTEKLIWIDCEMTGLDVQNNHLLEIAVILTDSNLDELNQIGPLFIHANEPVLNSMNDWCKLHFSENGLIEECKKSTLTIDMADNLLNEFLVKNGIKKGILAGNSLSIDRRFLDKFCTKFVSNLHYRMVDVSSLKVLVDLFYKDRTFWNKPTKHRALDDIKQSIEELKYYKNRYLIQRF